MIAYVDASVLLRLALGQRDSLREWRKIHQGVSSALITIEVCARWIACASEQISRILR